MEAGEDALLCVIIVSRQFNYTKGTQSTILYPGSSRKNAGSGENKANGKTFYSYQPAGRLRSVTGNSSCHDCRSAADVCSGFNGIGSNASPLQPKLRGTLLYCQRRRKEQSREGGMELRGRGLVCPEILFDPGLPPL